MRLFLHLGQVQHVYPGGYLAHHLLTDRLITIPAPFVLTFRPRSRFTAVLSGLALP